MIKHLGISNFKNLRALPKFGQAHLNFADINVFIGPNGSGKSSFLQAIDFLRAFFLSSVEVYLQERGWDYRDLPNLRDARKTIQWELVADLAADSNGRSAGTYYYTITLSPRKYLGIGKERLEYQSESSPRELLLERKGRLVKLLNRKNNLEQRFEEVGLPASLMSRLDHRRDQERFPELLHFRNWIERFRSFLLWDPKVLRLPDRGKHDMIGSSGEHLAPLLARLKRERPDSHDKLMKRVRSLFPTVSEISVHGEKNWGWQNLRLHETNGENVTFNSQQMSDGVLRLLALTSLLYLDRMPSVITLEEPENGVHPQLLREVVQILRELTLRKPPNQCQVFFTTHSPYVLDEFYDHPEQVFCVERGRPLEGASITPLSERSQLKNVQKAFDHSLGEAWATGLLGATA